MDGTVQIVQDPMVPESQKRFVMNKRKVYLFGGIGILFLFLIIGTAIFFYLAHAKPAILATVNKQPVYTSYLDQELALYPGPKSDQIDTMLNKKVIDDQIILNAGQKEGIIDSYPEGSDVTKEQYIERTKKVAEIKKVITEKENSVEGELVSIWFYNNGYIGPEGYEKSQQIALDKITGYYNRVKNKELTMKQAGELIATDTSLAQIDKSYKENAYTAFHIEQGKPITFWKPFDDMLINLKPGEVTPIYLGDSWAPDGLPTRDGMYIFGQLDKKIDDATYSSFEEWFEKQKQESEIQQTAILLPYMKPINIAYAQEDNNTNTSAQDESYLLETTAACGHGCPPFEGVALSKTGAPLIGVTITLKNARNESQQTTTNDKGEYFFEAKGNFSCGTSPMRFSISIPRTVSGYISTVSAAEESCGEVVKSIGNAVALQTVAPVVCEGPIPTPVLMCNKSCITSDECSKGVDDCKICLPSEGGSASGSAMTCQPPPPTPTPTPILMCNKTCTTSTECSKGVDSCSQCLPNAQGTKVCQPAPACNSQCFSSDYCKGAPNGCTTCSGGTCKAPACNIACSSDVDCKGAKDSCTTCKPDEETGQKVCQPKFNAKMCKCDGMDFTVADGASTFFPGSDVSFIAFGKVEGTDIEVADITSMQFSLYQSTLTDPNKATRIAQSTAITPEVVENTAAKVRYKVTWNQKIPSTVPSGSLFRVQADIKCSAKPGVLGASTNQAGNVYTDIIKTVKGMLTNTKTILGDTTEDNQQADTFFPGAKISEKSCSIIKFYFD